MSQLAKALQALLDSPKTANFVSSLKHSDLPTGWQNDDEIVSLAGNAYKEMGTDSPFFKAFEKSVGKTEPMYHGTPNKFDTFSYQNMGSTGSAHGSGYYLTPDKDLAKGYGDNVMDLFAVTENSFTPRSRLLSKEKIKNIARDVATNDFARYADELENIGDTTLISGYGNMQEESLEKILDRIASNSREYNTNPIAQIDEIGSLTDFDILQNAVKKHTGKTGIKTDNENIFVSLQPTHMKSQQNRGTFDPADPNIYRALPYLVGGGVGAGSLLGGNDEAEAMPFKPSLFDEAQDFVSSAMRNWNNNVKLPQDMTRQDYEYLANQKIQQTGKEIVAEIDNLLRNNYANEDELYQAFDDKIYGNYFPYLLESQFIKDESENLVEALEYLTSIKNDISKNKYEIFQDDYDEILNELQNNSNADFTNEAKEMLVPFLEKLGLGVDFNTSNKSNSMYFDVFDNSGNRKKIRFSDHDLPSFYDESDYDIRFSSRADDVLYEFGNAIDDMLSNSGIKIFDEIEIPDETPNLKTNKAIPYALGGGSLALASNAEASEVLKQMGITPGSQGVQEALWSPTDLAIAPIGAVGAGARALAMALDLPITYSLDQLLNAIIGD